MSQTNQPNEKKKKEEKRGVDCYLTPVPKGEIPVTKTPG